MECSFRAVVPTNPVAPYIGGKHNLAEKIIDIINTIPHACYAEPFVGMGGIFLRRSLAAKSEVINDINCDVATLFRILQRHYVAFMEMIKFQLTTRAEFERLIGVDPSTLTDLERAARFLYLQRTSFGGKVVGRKFGISPGYSGRFDVTKLGPMLEDVHTRLAGVIIECLQYDEFISKYDRDDTLFYLDPPYWNNENDYGREVFYKNDFKRLAEILTKINGHFIMSINDIPEIHDIFRMFHIISVKTTYSIQAARNCPAQELIISNGDAKPIQPILI